MPLPAKRVTVKTFAEKKKAGEPIVVVTAYDFPQALACDAAGVDAVLVGDSVANTTLGRPDTLSMTMDEMIHHTRAVGRAVKRTLVIGDMPFMSYQSSSRETLRNASRFLKEGGAQAVKLEWGADALAATRLLVGNGIPVMGHLGFTPQHVHRLGGARIQGKGKPAAAAMVKNAKALQAAGVFSVVLELLPPDLARRLTKALKIPTIGIGAGPHTSGQVQVLHDLAGMDPGFKPRHSRVYADLYSSLRTAVERYARDVRRGRFPSETETSHR